MTDRTEIHTDRTFKDQTGAAAQPPVVARTLSGRQDGTLNYEKELSAMEEAVKMAAGPCTIVSDHEGIVGVARRGMTPRMCKPLWEELYAAAAGKDMQFVWRTRDQSLCSRLAHQLARDAVRGR